jgi:hypothetical protein
LFKQKEIAEWCRSLNIYARHATYFHLGEAEEAASRMDYQEDNQMRGTPVVVTGGEPAVVLE